eukprot:scaffold474787_cov49-Prasinocladus_malaysianus.AAC.1
MLAFSSFDDLLVGSDLSSLNFNDVVWGLCKSCRVSFHFIYSSLNNGRGEGAPDADMIIYVASSEVGCGQSTLGYAQACSFDPATGRPIAGYVNFCPQ